MGLSEEDKKKHPYYKEMKMEEEKKRWGRFTRSTEYVKAEEAYTRALEDHLHQLIMADFFAKELEPTVEQVASATTYWIVRINDVLTRTRFYLIQKMLERFELVQKENKKAKEKG